jgi:hypothetical protein
MQAGKAMLPFQSAMTAESYYQKIKWTSRLSSNSIFSTVPLEIHRISLWNKRPVCA